MLRFALHIGHAFARTTVPFRTTVTHPDRWVDLKAYLINGARVLVSINGGQQAATSLGRTPGTDGAYAYRAPKHSVLASTFRQANRCASYLALTYESGRSSNLGSWRQPPSTRRMIFGAGNPSM